MVPTRLLLASVVALGPETCCAQSDWPQAIAGIEPGTAIFPDSARLDNDDPGPVPPSSGEAGARWYGRWDGWMCINRRCDIKLVVSAPSTEGTPMRVAMTGFIKESTSEAVVGKVAGDEIVATLRSGGTVALRLRTATVMEVLYVRDSLRAFGVLTRVEAFRAPEPPVKHNAAFDGAWDLGGFRHGELIPWGIRLDVKADGTGQWRVLRRDYVVAGFQVCRQTMTPLTSVAYTERVMTFEVKQSSVIAGCPDYSFAVRLNDSNEVVGYMQTIENSKVIGANWVKLSRP